MLSECCGVVVGLLWGCCRAVVRLLWGLLLGCSSLQAAERPNIVFAFADDWGRHANRNCHN